MAFVPASPLAFNYVQYQTTVQQEIVTVDGPSIFSSVSNIQILNLPQWLTVQNVYYNSSENKVYFTLKVKESYAFSMAQGDYNAGIKVKLNTGILSATWTSSTYNVLLTVTHVVLLSLSPTTLPFNFLIGGNTPQNQSLNITSENNWTIIASQSWVTLSQSTGINSGQVFIGVDPTALTVGQYSAIITVQDAQSTKNATVTLNVTEGDTDTEFLYVAPQSLQFLSELGVTNLNTSSVSVEASGSWTAVSSAAWLNISVGAGTSGINALTVSVDSIALTDLETPYLAQITFTQQNLQKVIYVELFLVEFFINGIESETLYFADDRNKLQVTNILPNMFLYLEGVLNNGTINQLYKLSAPYQNGLAKVLFGLETNVMLKSIIPTNNFTTRVKNNISPVTINFTAYNKQLNSGASNTFSSWQNVRFLTGKTPVNNKLCNIPSTIHVTKNAVLSLSILAEDGVNEISITGDATANYNTTIAEDLLVYNAIIDLSELNLTVGAAITITFGSLVLNVVVKEEGLEQTFIGFENEWREYEIFECTGKLEKDDKADATETEIQVEGTTHTKTVSIIDGKDYTLNTGHVYSQNEIDWLAKILKAKRIFIYQDGEPVEITLTTKVLKTYETRTAYNAFKLKFKKAIVE